MKLDQQLFSFFQQNKGLPIRSMTVFNYLLEATLFGSLLILMVLVIRSLFRSKLGNRAIYVAWLLVAVRLLVPIALPNPLMNELRPTLSTDLEARPVADQIRVRTQDAAAKLSYSLFDAAYESGNTNHALSDTANVVHNLYVVYSYGWLGKWVLIAYLTVDGGVLAYMAWQNLRFRRKMKQNVVGELEGEQLALYHALCKQRGVKPVPVLLVDPLPSACLVGVWKPYIALPLTLSDTELPQVLSHEICHLKAGDPWWAALRNLCCVVHWFNPLVWIAARCVRTDCELACDERVTAPMNSEERSAYAGTLVLAAAKRNAPRMSVLATGMTMTGKRLKQRVKAIVENNKKLLWLVAVMGTALALCTALAFFTADVPEQPWELQMQKAMRQFSLDGKMAVRVPENVQLDARPITNSEDALAYARELLNTPYLANMTGAPEKYGDLIISSFEDEWRVDAPAMPNGFELYFNSEGKLLYWDECYPLASETYPHEEELVKAPIEAYVRQFAEDCLGNPQITSVRIDEQRYTLEERYVYGRAMNGTNALFSFAIEPFTMRMVGFMDLKSTHFGNGTFFSHAVDGLRSRMFAQTSITHEEMRRSTFTVEALDSDTLCTTLTIPAEGLSKAFLEELENDYGKQTVYRYQHLTDRYGEHLDYRTPEAYRKRSDATITRQWAMEAATVAAAHLYGTEPANVTCSTADLYSDWGWYMAYCSYQPGEVKQLITLRLDAYDGTVLSVEPVILEDGVTLAAADLAALPTPQTPMATQTPAPEPTGKPEEAADGMGITFTDGTHTYVLPVTLMYNSTGVNASPNEASMSITDAGCIAAEAICAEYGLSYAELPNYYLRGEYITEETVENVPKWWFNLVIQSTNECRYTVGISLPEGIVEHISGPGDGNG